MSRKVMCRKYKQELDGLAQPPLPTAKGQDIFENISQKAWDEWQAHQTRLINEKQLSMMDPGARKYLNQQQDAFFSGGDLDEIEGYVPEDK